MGLIIEPKGVDFIIKSEPWTDQELTDFRKLMEREKAKNKGKADTEKNKQKDNSIPSTTHTPKPTLIEAHTLALAPNALPITPTGHFESPTPWTGLKVVDDSIFQKRWV